VGLENLLDIRLLIEEHRKIEIDHLFLASGDVLSFKERSATEDSLIPQWGIPCGPTIHASAFIPHHMGLMLTPCLCNTLERMNENHLSKHVKILDFRTAEEKK
jgi:hypothetical protein